MPRPAVLSHATRVAPGEADRASLIPAESLPDSRHRLLRLTDVLAFQAERERRGEARRAIMQIVEDENLPH